MAETNRLGTAPPPSEPESNPIAVTEQNGSVEQSSTKDIPHTDATATSISTTSSSLLQTLTDKALDFLSTASNEALGACLVGLGASTYFVLGRVGLVIIGVAGGVVLHATWADLGGNNRDEATKRAKQERHREAGIEVARRLLEWRSRISSQTQEKAVNDVRVYASQELSFASSFGPEATNALNTFTDAVIKDYVHYWYDPSMPGESNFPASCKRTFMAFVLSLAGHLHQQRPADSFMTFLTNASSLVIVFLHELSLALNASPNSPPEEAVSSYLKLKPDCSLSYMLDQKSQKLKLADVSESILQDFLDPKSYNCPLVHSFLKEVLAQLVLGYTVDMCSRPEWINDWIVYGLEESETTKEVMDIVDASVEGRAERDIPKAVERIVEQQQSPVVGSRKEDSFRSTAASASTTHKRTVSKAEEAMDEAMREAQRLTEMMIEEDRRRAQEEEKRRPTTTVTEDSSDGTTQDASTPSSGQSDQEQHEEESTSSKDSPALTEGKPAQFTSFDQIVPATQPTALTDDPAKAPSRPQSMVLTLHNANLSIFDDSIPGERSSLKAKPTTDYNILIEPASVNFGGWMVIRKYADFETLHEVLRRISVITGARFNEFHAELPKWKTHTKASLRTELERYLCDAVRYQSLAESEGMKRFLEKDKGMSKSPGGGTKGFGWPTPDAFGKLGGDMMNVLTKAPKQVAGGVAGGGKAVFGGVAGLVGAGKRINASPTSISRSTTELDLNDAQTPESQPRQSTSDNQSFLTDPMTGSFYGTVSSGRESQESLRAPLQSGSEQRRSSTTSTSSQNGKGRQSETSTRPSSIMSSRELTQLPDVSTGVSLAQQPSKLSLEETMNLPPPPSEMPADYASTSSPARESAGTVHPSTMNEHLSISLTKEEEAPAKPPRPQPISRPVAKPKEPISERETSDAVELMFAIITELYTLSGAWQIRRTLLNAAKTFLLRPGNPQLTSIRDLLQTSLLDSNLNDSGLAHHIYKLRENTLPTVEELEIWKRDYPEKTDEQKEELRIKARKLLVTKGMPQALTSVMGATASGEALGKVFDCLQVPEISRALIFGLMVQALRVVIQ